jgi:hypothetical protein
MMWRGRRSFRNSSKAQQKRAAASRVSQAEHRIGPLLDPSMVLLEPMIEILVHPMLYVTAYYLMYCPRIGRMAVRRYLIGSRANNSTSLFEKLLGCLHLPLLAQPRSNQIALLIDRPRHITPPPMHFQGGLIHLPGCPCLSMSPVWYLFGYQWSKTCFPISDGLGCAGKSAC